MKNDAQVTVPKMIGIVVCRARGFLKFESAPNQGLSPTQLPSGGSPVHLSPSIPHMLDRKSNPTPDSESCAWPLYWPSVCLAYSRLPLPESKVESISAEDPIFMIYKPSQVFESVSRRLQTSPRRIISDHLCFAFKTSLPKCVRSDIWPSAVLLCSQGTCTRNVTSSCTVRTVLAESQAPLGI